MKVLIQKHGRVNGALEVSHRDQGLNFGVVMFSEPDTEGLTRFLSISTASYDITLRSVIVSDISDGLPSAVLLVGDSGLRYVRC